MHDLYLSFSGGTGYLFNLNHFVFTGGTARMAVSSAAASMADKDVQLSPNPAGNVLNFETSQKLEQGARMLIYDNTGRLVFDAKLPGNKTTVDVGGFTPGMYMLKLFNGRHVITKKFLKK